MKRFFRYSLIGCGNTLVHWLCFAFFLRLDWPQAVSNVTAFVIAASASFVFNAKFTFKAQMSVLRLGSFYAGMGGIGYLTGLAGDLLMLPPIVTLVVFSLTSLGVGFLFSKCIVFRGGHASYDQPHRAGLQRTGIYPAILQGSAKQAGAIERSGGSALH